MTFINVLFASICWLCSLLIGAISLWAFKRKEPVHFWSGSTVRPEEISDIPSYNRSNGLMWAIYTFCMIVAGILSLFSMKIGAILLTIICIPGIIVLIIVYNRIYKKYRSATVTHNTDFSASKTAKPVVAAMVLISAIIVILASVLIYYGEKDIDVSIYDNQLK